MVVLVVCLEPAPRALAQPTADAAKSAGRKTVDECIEHHRNAQTLRRRGAHTAAVGELKSCLDPHCSPLLREACAVLIKHVEAEAPSIILKVTSAQMDLTSVTVHVGDRLLAEELDGRPISLDPGRHELRFEAAGRQPLTQVIVLRIGEQGRVVAVELSPTPAPDGVLPPTPPMAGPIDPRPPAPASESPSAAAAKPHVAVGVPPNSRRWDYALIGGGLALGAAGAIVGLSAMDDRSDCPPCSEARRDRILVKALVADGLFVLAAAAAGYGAFRLFTAGGGGTSASLRLGPGYISAQGRF